MIDNFALGLSHLLMIVAALLLLRRADLDRETGKAAPAPAPAEQPRPAARFAKRPPPAKDAPLA